MDPLDNVLRGAITQRIVTLGVDKLDKAIFGEVPFQQEWIQTLLKPLTQKEVLKWSNPDPKALEQHIKNMVQVKESFLVMDLSLLILDKIKSSMSKVDNINSL